MTATGSHSDSNATVQPQRFEPPPQRAATQYDFLDGLRGLTACYVLLYHFIAYVPSVLPGWITHLRQPLSFGHAAVSVFIVLSGFSLMLPVVASGDGRLRGGITAYMARRCKRILPAYFPALVFSIVVTAATSNIGVSPTPDRLTMPDIVLHCFLLHNLSSTYAHTINIALWSVAAEFDIYLIFALMLLPCWRIAGNIVTVLIAFGAASVPILLFPRSFDLSWTCPWYIGLFATGMVAATVKDEKLNGRAVAALSILAISLAIAYFILHLTLLSPYRHDFHKVTFVTDLTTGLIVACGLLIGVAHARGRVKLPIFRLLETRPMRFLGSISYSLYLLHAAVLSLCLWSAMRMKLDATESFWLRATIGIAVSLFLAAISARCFEQPFLKARPVQMGQ